MVNFVRSVLAISLAVMAVSQADAQSVFLYEDEISEALAKCDAGDKVLCAGIGEYYLLENPTDPALFSKSLDYFSKACALGHADSCYLAGSFFTLVDSDGFAAPPFKPDFERGMGLFEKGCDTSDVMATPNCTQLALFYFEGRYDSITLEQAYQYALAGCDVRSFESCYALYTNYEKIATIPNVVSKAWLLDRGKELELLDKVTEPQPPVPF